MAMKRIMSTLLLLLLLVLVNMVGHVSSDFAQDKKECQDQLVSFSPCITFAGGDSESPPPSPPCCAEIQKDYNKTKKCLCTLVKDRNEPQLGFKINATQALSLPFLCHAPGATTSDCVAVLQLPPNSPDAQIFEQFAISMASNGNNSVTRGDTSKSSTSNTLKGKWDGLRRVIGNITLWLVISFFMINSV